ncbi:MAG: type III PLP-dependent enzyme, partial [Deltaproteobacteria bacterium]|nr:type III PLP-dependent enzyme [Deltaproteobacteria bacterium]
EKTEGVQDSVIAGPTCDSFDVVYNSYPLPELSLGDILLVTSMGAYTVASATYFNGFAPARIIAID